MSTGFDVRNTIDAMLARYYLFTGQYQQALDAAKRVDLTKVSVLAYPDPAVNPIYNYSSGGRLRGTAQELGPKRGAG